MTHGHGKSLKILEK